jgi:amino acid transporter
MILIAQMYAITYAIVLTFIFFALIAIGVPPFRKRSYRAVMEAKKKKRRRG